ncbi:phosphatase PAP2 family protein [Cellulosimicrobium sp. Marseille-Q8652]
MRHRRSWGAVLAALCAASLVGVYALAVRTASGQAADVQGFAQLQAGGYPVAVAATWTRAALPAALALLCLGLGAHALRTRRFRDVVGALAVAVVPLALSGWLRDGVLSRPDLGDFGYAHNTMPSGHVSAAVGLVVAAVLLWPARTRRGAARVALVVVVLACVASVVGHAHRPSDTIASVLLVGLVTGIVVAVLDVPSAPAPATAFTRAPQHEHR